MVLGRRQCHHSCSKLLSVALHHLLSPPRFVPICVQRQVSQTSLHTHVCALLTLSCFPSSLKDTIATVCQQSRGTFPAYTPALSHTSVCEAVVAVASVEHRRVVSSISRSKACGQFLRVPCAHRCMSETFRRQRQHSVAPFRSVRSSFLLSS